MTVAELIEQLQHHPPTTQVFISNEGGTQVSSVESVIWNTPGPYVTIQVSPPLESSLV